MTDLESLSPQEGVERFLEHREQSLLQSALENDRTRLNYFLEWAEERGIKDLNDLSGRDLADFVAWRSKQVAPITLQKQLSSIREGLRWWADIEAVEPGLAEKVHAPELPDGAESSDVYLEADRAKIILEQLGRYHVGSRQHVVMEILWRTAMRRSALHSIDIGDLDDEEHAVELRHRPDQGTRLKNGADGERDVYLGPMTFNVIEAWIDHPDRPSVTDEYGRRPLLTTKQGRANDTGTIYKDALEPTRPCEWGDCPHGQELDECPAAGSRAKLAQCPSSRAPHAIRRGRITYDLNRGTSPEAISERADVSLDVLERHYDARTKREKMQVRKEFFEEGAN